ncbi:MAG: diguanylate cyclase [Acidimicrobiales bacterium]|nr:diguanylate cyclase [Acidimicrobiales bacterium]
MTAEPGDQRERIAAAVAEHCPDVLVLLDDAFTVRFCSGAAAAALGVDPSALEGTSALEWVHPDDLAYAAGGLAEAQRSTREHAAARIRLRTPQGWAEADARPGQLFDVDDLGTVVVLALRPTGEHAAFAARRLELESLLARVAVRCAGSPWQLLADVTRSALRSLCGVLHAELAQLLSLDVSPPSVQLAFPSDATDVVPPWWTGDDVARSPCVVAPDVDDLPGAVAGAFRAAGLRMVVDVPLLGRRGPEHVLRLGWSERTDEWDDANTGTVQALVDVLLSSLRRAETDAMTHHAALHDPLTGLVNRRRAVDLIDEELRHLGSGRRRGVALLLGDLDGFKQLNDTCGHDAGDRALVEVAERLSREVRADDVVARYGGDEFLVLMTDVTDADDVERLASRLAAAVAGVDSRVPLGMSIGSAATHTVTTAEVLLARADAAMYAVKRSRRDSQR